MKPDGVTMETTEPTEAAGVAEQPSSQDNITEQVPSQPEEAANDAPEAVPKANGKPVEMDSKVKPKAVATKTQATFKSTGSSGSNSRPGTASHRMGNDVKSSNNVSAVAVKKTTTTTKPSAAGAVPKRPLGVAAVSTTVKNQTRVPDKKPVGPTRTTSVAAATVTNGTKPTTVNGTPKKRPAAETVNVARPKTGTTSRPLASTAPKPSTSTTTKVGGAAVSKTSRPATVPSTSRPVATTSRPTTATTKPSTTATAKTTASRVTTATSTGRTTATQPPKTAAAAKKDVSRPPSSALTKKPATTTSAAPKKSEPSKPAATVRLNSASKWSATTKATDPKVSQSKTPAPVKPPTKKPAAALKFPALNKPPLGRTPPSSPANKPASSGTSQAKRGTKPTQAVPPFTAIKKAGNSNATIPAVEAPSAACTTVEVAAAGTTVEVATAGTVLVETQAEATVSLSQEPVLAASTTEEISPPVLAQEVGPQESVQNQVSASSPSQSPVRDALPHTSPQEQLESSAPLQMVQEQMPSPGEQTLPPVASPPNLSKEPVYLSTDQTLPTSISLPAAENASPPIASPTNLNEEEDEEEREGSQLVSLSEMSGTTQPTEESRPGSAGLVSGSVWRAGGALLSELDSEDVSGSQQGASELSAPGVLEGTESMDDLGDGSLKGAIDMEGASAGSPDFEKVPDIPVNDFDEEEDDDDDNDRVCDMDVGSEQTDEPQRPRHDNDVEEEEEDDDVEMASEGVTESGLESYGNADEDDFAEDERLDNLNRVAQPPPPPPLLPAAPAAQWDQPNPFADPWAELLQPQQVLEHISQPEQMAGAVAASPLADPWQADSETPTQTPAQAQAWLELGSAHCVSESQDHSSCEDKLQNLDHIYLDQPSPVPMQTLAPAHLSAPGMSLSSTLSSDTSTPEELGDYNRVEKFQPQDAEGSVPSSQPDLVSQNLGMCLERGDGQGEEEAEPKTLPADEVRGGPSTAPISNPSSSSVTEDEASDTEGEAQLDDCSESSAVNNIIFDSQPPTQRCLSTVEEGEEAEEDMECGAGEDTTPPSATSLASYGFDTMTTASNSHAQSTGESCIKSPGIFSLEELPEEPKEPCLTAQPHILPCLAEQHYIECGKQEAESAEHVGDEAPASDEALDPSSTLNTSQQQEEIPDDIQPPYYSAICEKTENFFAGFTALPHPHRRDHSAHPRTYCDIVKPLGAAAAATAPKLTCADLPPRGLGQKALSPQLRRLEQHQRQLLELQQRREAQSRPLEEAEQERKRREEEEQRKKKEEAEEEIKRNKEEEERKMREQAEQKKREEEEKVKKEEELKQRRDLELQLQQQQQELKQRQQIMQWQQELQESNKGQTVLLSPSSGLCTIYEALESSEEEAEGEEEEVNELNTPKRKKEPKKETSSQEMGDDCKTVMSDKDKPQDTSWYTETPLPHPDSPQTPNKPSQDEDDSSPCPPESPERPPPLDLDWGKKVDIVQQLINQTLLLNGDGCSSLLLLPGGAGGTLSPLESSLWPSLLPPLTPPSATVTSVSSFSPEATGNSPQGEWTVVELETHH